MTTDIPAAFMAWRGGDLKLKDYIKSLRDCDVEAVYSFKDPLPGFAEFFLIPYLAVKRGF
jgi:D-aspartate ligase